MKTALQVAHFDRKTAIIGALIGIVGTIIVGFLTDMNEVLIVIVLTPTPIASELNVIDDPLESTSFDLTAEIVLSTEQTPQAGEPGQLLLTSTVYMAPTVASLTPRATRTNTLEIIIPSPQTSTPTPPTFAAPTNMPSAMPPIMMTNNANARSSATAIPMTSVPNEPTEQPNVPNDPSKDTNPKDGNE